MWAEALYDGETVLAIQSSNLKATLIAGEAKLKLAISENNCESAKKLRSAKELYSKGRREKPSKGT